MKKVVLVAVVCLLLSGSANNVLGDFVFVSGDVSGTWCADSVIVTDEVRVPPRDTLIICPGVEVLFWVHCKFVVDTSAVLYAVGTEADSIVFDEYWPGNYWHGLRFINSSDSCKLSYCQIKHGWATGGGADADGGGLYASRCSLSVTNSLITSCSAGNDGGGIYSQYSTLEIDNSTISQNSANEGGGVYYLSSDVTITRSAISGNSGSRGAGILCEYSTGTISGNSVFDNQYDGIRCEYFGGTVSENTVSENTGDGIVSIGLPSPLIRQNVVTYNHTGIECWADTTMIIGNTVSHNADVGVTCGGSATIADNIITWNTTNGAQGGGGIYCYSSNAMILRNKISANSAIHGGGISCTASPAFEDNEVSNNVASGNGGGYYLSSANPTLTNETIAYNDANLGGGIYCTNSNPVINNAILWGNDPWQIYQVSLSNAQVTYSDLEQIWPGTGNIFVDPQFVDAASGNYHLLASSPCIDTGDPDTLYNDPDGTRADMGCYYHGHAAGISPDAEPPELHDIVLFPAQPNPFGTSAVLRFSTPKGSNTNLTVFDIKGGAVAVLVDGWISAGVHQVVLDGHRLAPGVYFAKLTAGEMRSTCKLVIVR